MIFAPADLVGQGTGHYWAMLGLHHARVAHQIPDRLGQAVSARCCRRGRLARLTLWPARPFVRHQVHVRRRATMPGTILR